MNEGTNSHQRKAEIGLDDSSFNERSASPSLIRQRNGTGYNQFIDEETDP
jgi:hypothetical protein